MKCYPGKQGPLITKDALQFQKSMLYNSPNVFLIEGNVKENISNMLLLLYIGDQLLNVYSRTLSSQRFSELSKSFMLRFRLRECILRHFH